MLILTRRANESIMIGDDIKFTVLSVKGRVVRLGIEAPRHIPIDREEVAERKAAERRIGRDRALDT